jgi:K+-transporting ATPase ATPase A chain
MIDLLLPFLVIGGTIALSWPLGRYLAWAMAPESDTGRLGAHRQRYEGLAARVVGPLGAHQQGWKAYCVSLLVFNAVMWAWTFLILATQQWLPLNPDDKGALGLDLVFNTASSFTTNTNLQHYSGEVSMSYLTQIGALMWLQFVSAATGLAALAAIARGLAGRVQMGNFFRDVHRATFLVLLPLSAVAAVALLLMGMPMTFQGAAIAETLEGARQTIARGPVAAFVAIKQLGTNGGGFFGPNSTHPFENPSFWSNVLENVAILLVPMACVWMVGRLTGRLGHARVVFGVMLLLFASMVSFAAVHETTTPTAAFADLPVADEGNLEGKELRTGATAGPLWGVSTTATSNGSVGAMHDSFNPLTGLMPMIGMWLNSVFGGVGVGYINMLLYIVVAVFIAGLMVGRTPEYLGKKVEAREMKLALLPLLLHPLLILGGTAVFAVTPWGLTAIQDAGSHGLSEILYEFSSAAANNGSGFEGLGDGTVAWNVTTGVFMLLGRFVPIIAPLAIAGSLAAKRPSPETAGTFRTDTLTFGVILTAVVLVIGALLFLPAAVLGPVAEHLASVAPVAP